MTVIALVGLKHAGKSSVAAELAARTGRTWVDTDREVEARCDGTTVRTIWARDDGRTFRDVEARAVAWLVESHRYDIIATGGGIADNAVALASLRQTFVVYLSADADRLYRRIVGAGVPAFLDANDPEASWRTIAARRGATYAAIANLTVDTTGRTVGEIATIVAEQALRREV